MAASWDVFHLLPISHRYPGGEPTSLGTSKVSRTSIPPFLLLPPRMSYWAEHTELPEPELVNFSSTQSRQPKSILFSPFSSQGVYWHHCAQGALNATPKMGWSPPLTLTLPA